MPQSLRRRFGTHLRALRQSRRLTQEALADKSSLSVDAIRRMERGNFSPSLETLSKLTSGLQLSLHTLFSGFEQPYRSHQVAELADYLSHREPEELRLASRVVRALFEDN